MARRRSDPGFGSAFNKGAVTFGIEGDYDNPEDAINAYNNAYDDPINGVGGTTGAGGFQGTRFELDENGRPVDGKSHSGWGLPYSLPGYRLGKVDIAAQEQRPENPGIRKIAFSTWGIPIPVSIGRRAITGNVVDASDIIPVMIGTEEYWVEYKIPIYETGSPE